MTVFFHYSLYGSANVYLLGNDQSGKAVVVDPAAFTGGLLSFIEGKGYEVEGVLLTHSHLHHNRGLKTLLKIYDATVYANNPSIDGLPCQVVRGGETFETCGFLIQALSVPGHSSDSLAFKAGKIMFTGDAIQAGLVGRTASKYGLGLLTDQIAQKILSQSDDTVLLPAHGPPSTVGAERLYNLGLREANQANQAARYDFFV